MDPVTYKVSCTVTLLPLTKWLFSGLTLRIWSCYGHCYDNHESLTVENQVFKNIFPRAENQNLDLFSLPYTRLLKANCKVALGLLLEASLYQTMGSITVPQQWFGRPSPPRSKGLARLSHDCKVVVSTPWQLLIDAIKKWFKMDPRMKYHLKLRGRWVKEVGFVFQTKCICQPFDYWCHWPIQGYELIFQNSMPLSSLFWYFQQLIVKRFVL